MKVLIYTHYFAPSTGGVETYVKTLAQGFSRRGQKAPEELTVTVVTQTPANSAFDKNFSFPVVRCPTRTRLFELVRRNDIVHLAGPTIVPMVFALLTQTPFVIEQHGYQAGCPTGLLLYKDKEVCPGYFLTKRYHKCVACTRPTSSLASSLMGITLTFARRILCKFANANLPISNHVLQRLQLPHSQVIYYGIEEPTLPPSKAINAKVSSPPCFAYVGRLVSEKGVAVLIDATRRLRDQGQDVQLKLIGDGPQRNALERAAAEWKVNDRILFTGVLTGQDLEKALEGTVALVMPSICEETAGLSAIEQMFRGRLVIASDIGGLGEVVGDAGLRFPAGDASALADRMREAIEKPDIAYEVAQKALLRARAMFSLDRMLDAYLTLYPKYTEGRD